MIIKEKKERMQSTKGFRNTQTGFSLMEMIIVVGIFSFAILIATSVFLLATKAQRQSSTSQKLQGDIRYAIEAMARDVKFGTIDYGCYAALGGVGHCDPFGAGPIDLDTAKGKTLVLAVVDSDGNRRRYRAWNSNGTLRLSVCSTSVAASDPINKCDDPVGRNGNVYFWQSVTPDGVQVPAVTFYLAPFCDPYALKNAGQVGLNCVVDATSPFPANAQPRVTIVMQSKEKTTFLTAQTITSQTTASSRFYAR